ncbi:MAG: phenylalanine--tRNA ligase subunit beta [Candidatus Acidiferrales bacterium]
MKVLHNVLKEFVKLTAAPAEVCSRLSLSGTSVDAIDDTPAGPVLDAEVTINRPDCLGHYGIAREVAALYRLPLKPVRPKFTEAGDTAASAARVDIESPELCGRYTARVVRGVKVQPSPDWLRQRLEALGQASINNVVDVTNYVMLELGQAIHAFDLDRLAGRHIIVRRAKPGEKMRTLDGVERTLTREMCVIADQAHAVAIGGVMGGAESEIRFATQNVLIEAAWFDSISVRRTSKTLGLRTEASQRFERGGDIEMPEVASRRVAELIQQLAGGEVLAGVVDVFPGRAPQRSIDFSRHELLRIMGADVADREIEEILGALGFQPVRSDPNRGSAGSLAAVWRCQQPSWRQDVTREIDLVEEVARIYGLEKFPARLSGTQLPAGRLPHAAAEDRLRERLIALGYHEIVTIPLVDPKQDATFRSEGTIPAVMANPLAEDASVMQTSGLLNMVHTLAWNLNRGQRNLHLFETGKKYELRDGSPHETRILTLGATGLAREKSIHENAREFEFADLKGELDSVGELAGGWVWTHGGPPWLATGRAAQIAVLEAGGESIGAMGLLGPRAGESFKLRQAVYLAELRLEPLLEAIEKAQAALHYEPVPRFPAVVRDFSLVLSDVTTFDQVEETIRGLQIAELQRIEAKDLYRGKNLPGGKHSLLVQVTLQSAQATLTDEQLTDFSSRIVAALEKNLGATLRAT